MFVWLWAEVCTDELAVHCGSPGETWTWLASLTFLSLAIKVFELYVAACTAAWCLPLWNMSGINLLQKQTAESEACLLVQAACSHLSLPGWMFASGLELHLVFCKWKHLLCPSERGILMRFLETFCTFLWNLNLLGDRLFWKSRSKKMVPLFWRLRKQPDGCVTMPVPLINIDWECSEENGYIMCCGLRGCWNIGRRYQVGLSQGCHRYCVSRWLLNPFPVC